MINRRNTRQRQLILEMLKKQRSHPTADEIYASLKVIDTKLSRGTVYRNLNLLVGEGKVKQVKLQGAERFEFSSELHYHLTCTVCGKVSDVEMCYDASLDNKLSEMTGYKVKQHRIVFEGQCPECLNI